MSEIDNLEGLNNADLRAKCMQFGLPNVPVTDSTRKVLIKKLRVSMSGSPAPALASDAAQKKTNRRETIHVSKPVETAPPKPSTATNERAAPKTPNRRTIAAPTIAAVAKEEPPSAVEMPAPIGARRRSVREQIVQKVSTAAKQFPNIIVESDSEDELDLVKAVEQAEQKHHSTGRAAPVAPSRSSRSVSLTKTGVLTTSYNQEVTPLLEHDTEDEVESVVSSVPMLPGYNKKNVFDKYSSNATQQYTSRNTHQEPLSVRKMPTESYGARKPEPVASYKVPAAEPFAAYKVPSEPRKTYTQTSRQTLDSNRYTGSSQDAAPNYYSPSYRRSTAGMTTSTLYPNLQGAFYNEQSDDTETDAAIDEASTPFLSNFARNLERVKAEPLGRSSFGGAGDSLLGAVSDISARQRYKRPKMYEGVQGRRPKNDSLGDSFGQLIAALDEKYHLKRYFALLIVVLLTVFVYVVFFP